MTDLFHRIAKLRSIALVAIAALAIWCHPAAAGFFPPATGAPSPLQVNVISPQSLSVTWSLPLEIAVGPSATVSSPRAQVFINGAPVAQVRGLLSRTVPGPTLTTVTLRETIQVSRALARRIADGGNILLSRTFTMTPFSGGGTAMITATVPIRPTVSGGVSIRNIELFFDDESQYRIVSMRDMLRARAEITSVGGGMVELLWEHAGPGSLSAGNAVFQPLRRDRKPLNGSRRTVLESPPLPTAIAGVHIVRLRPTRLDGSVINEQIDPVELRYVVQPGGGDQGILLLSPQDAALLTPATRFTWQQLAGAAYLRVEFLEAGTVPLDDRAPRLASVDLPGTSVSTMLRPFTLHRLASGPDPIFWRVVAFDDAGNPIARSSLRQLGRAPSQASDGN